MIPPHNQAKDKEATSQLVWTGNTRFFYNKLFLMKMSLENNKNLRKMLRKSSVSNGWGATVKKRWLFLLSKY